MRSMTSSSCICRVLEAVLLAGMTAAQSPAQQSGASSQPTTGELLAPWLERLGHDSYLEREAATREIIQRGPSAAAAVQERLQGETDAEVRHRLRYILENITPPDQAVLVLRSAGVEGLQPGDVITHVIGRRVRSESELRQRMANTPGGLMLRVTGPEGPREIGPVSIAQLDELADFQAPRGAQIARAVREYADGFAERAFENLKSIGGNPPPNELSTLLHARIAYTAGAGTLAKNILESAGLRSDGDLLGRDWNSPSRFDLAGPGKAPYHLEWWLYTSRGPTAFEDRVDPDLRVQRVLIPANRFVDALISSCTLWWTRYREVLGMQDDDATRIAGNMLAVASWMFSDLDLGSECLRLIEPRSVILRQSSNYAHKWVRVRTDAWLPFFQGSEKEALDTFYEDARDVLQRPDQIIRNPAVAAQIAFFLYQNPGDDRIGELLRVVNHPGQEGLSEYAEWMAYALDADNEQLVRRDLAELLPTFDDSQAAPVGFHIALLEYVQRTPDGDVFEAARQRLAQAPDAGAHAGRLAVVDALAALSRDDPAAARTVLEAAGALPGRTVLESTIEFRANPPAAAESRQALRAPLLAVRAGLDGARWLILTRDRQLVLLDTAGGELTAVAAPTTDWYPVPAAWPWLGRDDESGRVWAYGRRRVVEVGENGEAAPIGLNIYTADIPRFDLLVAPAFGRFRAAVRSAPFPTGETGEFLRNEVAANEQFTTDPELPEIGFIHRLEHDPELVQVGLRGGPDLLIDTVTHRVWSSAWIAEQLGLAGPPTWIARSAVPTGPDSPRVVFLLSGQGLIRFDIGAERLELIPLPGEVPFPVVIPESVPYQRRDPRWFYLARLPEEGGAVFRLELATGRVERVDMTNEALPPEYYRSMSRADLRDDLDALLQQSDIPGIEGFIRDALERVAAWQKETVP